jgi:hypothetical protein
MRSVWWSAGAMADLGNAALKKASKSQEAEKAVDQKDQGRRAGVLRSANGTQREGDTVTTNGNGVIGSNVPETTLISSDLPLETTTELLPMDSALTFSSGFETNVSLPSDITTHISPDWFNFDTAFEKFDTVLGSSGADQSMELLRPFNFEDFGSLGIPE